MPFNLTREQLYDLVWSEPMQRLSKQIGISDVAIAKHCRKIGVPVPERGYWNKLQAGQKVTKTALPERDLATINHISMSGSLPAELRARINGEPGVSNQHDDSVEVLAERVRKRLGKVTVPRNFSRVHPVIESLLKKDEQYRQELALDRYFWHEPRFDAPFERRRLSFLNGLFLGFAQIGGTPLVRGDIARELAIYIGNVSVGFELDKVRTTQSRQRGLLPVPESGDRLCLTLSGDAPGVTTRWEDNEGSLLEARITEIIIGMLIAGEHFHRRWLEQKAAWERQRREEAEHAAQKRKEEEERRQRERLAAIEKAKLDDLLRSADAWRSAHNLRNYIKAVQAAAGQQQATDEFQAWSRWALGEANKLDPISSGRDMTPFRMADGDARMNDPRQR
jgi:hypothetical protein